MKTTYRRNVSPLEKLFNAIAATDPPFSNQMILEGSGEIDDALLEKAVAEAGRAHPGSRLRYGGRWLWARWVDSGVAPPVRVVDGADWSGYDARGAPFLLESFPYRTGPTCEVLKISGRPTRYVFRSLHAVMDATATLRWVHDIFRALRSEPLEGAPATMSDKAFVAGLKLPRPKASRRKNCLTPTGGPDGEAPGFVWKRVTLQGKFSKLMPRMALVAAREARRHAAGDVRIVVHHDLRRRVPDPGSSANLSRRFMLDIATDATIESIRAQVQARLDHLEGDPRGAALLSCIPTRVMQWAITSAREKERRRGFYKTSGTISNGGLLPLDQLQGGGFAAGAMFWIPPQMQTKPFFLSTVGYGDMLEVVMAMPNVLATRGRLDRFIDSVLAALKSGEEDV